MKSGGCLEALLQSHSRDLKGAADDSSAMKQRHSDGDAEQGNPDQPNGGCQKSLTGVREKGIAVSPR